MPLDGFRGRSGRSGARFDVGVAEDVGDQHGAVATLADRRMPQRVRRVRDAHGPLPRRMILPSERTNICPPVHEIHNDPLLRSVASVSDTVS
jgi:hypothetical protein